MNKFFKQLGKFASVGVLVTLLGLGLMFVFYNVFHWGYWISSATSYIVGSVVSYQLNRSFTFQHKGKQGLAALRFTFNIIVCYLAAYWVAKPMTFEFFNYFQLSYSLRITENVALVLGNVIFTSLNFVGQKFFVFKK